MTLEQVLAPVPRPCGRAVQEARERVADVKRRLAEVEAELAAHLAARGSRPGDGSDQATLFDVAEPNLFGG